MIGFPPALSSTRNCSRRDFSAMKKSLIGTWGIAGVLINTISMKYQIQEKKLAKLKSLLDICIQDGHCTYRYLAKIAGSVISRVLEVGPIARLFTRQMYLTIETRSSWDNVVYFSPNLLEELKFWFLNLDCFNGYSIRPPPTPCTIIFTDAIHIAFGGCSASLDSYWYVDIGKPGSKFYL